jgi:hypothetical protein
LRYGIVIVRVGIAALTLAASTSAVFGQSAQPLALKATPLALTLPTPVAQAQTAPLGLTAPALSLTFATPQPSASAVTVPPLGLRAPALTLSFPSPGKGP